MDKRYLNQLRQLNACQEAIDWASTQETPQAAWAACKRGDWMLWLCGKYAGEPWSKRRKRLVLAACECSRLALKYKIEKDDRLEEAIGTAER